MPQTFHSKILEIQHLDGISDHKLILLNLNLDKFKSWGNYYWKFNNTLLENNSFQQEVKNLINEYNIMKSLGTPHQNWSNFKAKIKKISKQFGSFLSKLRKSEAIAVEFLKNSNIPEVLMENVNQKENDLKKYQISGNLTRVKNKTLNNIYAKSKDLDRKEEFNKGTSKFIFRIKTNNTTFTEKHDILNEIQQFYQNLYSSQNIPDNSIYKYLENFEPPTLTNTQKENIGQYITEKEVDTVIKLLNKNKSPGNDGITAEFYQAFRPQLVPILTELYNNSFLQNNLPKEFKQGIITLIFKNKRSPDEIKNWRPISLLNLDYKILTKVLTMRLKNNISTILNNFQSCGPNKSIINNALNLKSIISYIRQNDQKYAIIALDQEKAFDRIEHNFLKIVFKKFDFPPNFIKWFEMLYTNIESKILINGTFTPIFKILRSVRQGCPLSMFLYALGLEPMIFRINSNPHILGIDLPNCENNTKSLQHADDTIVIIKDKKSYKYLNEETNLFGKNSGSKINQDKTEILTFGNWEDLKEITPANLFKDKIKVYGIIFGKNEIKENYEPKIQKIKQVINKWNNCYFNLFEKVIIIKTYIFSLLQYTMIFTDLPIDYIKQINTLLFQFLWSGHDKISRNTIFQDMFHGGLGLPSVLHKRESIIIQTLRRIELNLDQPWANLYIYWFGLNLKFYHAPYAANTYLHNIENFQENQHIKSTILKYRIHDNIWKIPNLRLIYTLIINKMNNSPTITLKYPSANWDLIWNNYAKIQKSNEKLIIFKYLHKILPTGEYYHKIGRFRSIPRCADCWLGPNTLQHIFETCTVHNAERTALLLELQNITPNIILNSNLLQTGNNDKTLDHRTQNQICTAIFKYTITIWKQCIKLKPP